jgi:hypothetical protein
LTFQAEFADEFVTEITLGINSVAKRDCYLSVLCDTQQMSHAVVYDARTSETLAVIR